MSSIYFHDKYFLIFNELQLDHCWLLVSDEFSNCLVVKGHCRLEIVRGSIELNGIRYSCPFSEILYSPLSSAKIGLRSNGGGENLNAALSEMARRGEWARGRLEALESNQGVAAALAADHKWSLLRLSASGDATIDDLVQFKEYKRLFDPDSEFPFAKKMRFSVTEKDGDGGGGSSNSEDAAATVDRCYILSDEMRRAIERVVDDWAASSAVSVALVGPKNAGKSSLLRAMINRLLAEKERRGDKTGVCVIDGDPGQSEFCTSGSLSLAIVSRPIFGPPFTHDCSSGDDNEDRATGRRVEIVEQMFIGDISPNDPKLYCRSIERLYHTYLSINESGERLPLLINTMGWLQGLGLVYLAFKLTLIDPTHIVHLRTGKARRDITDLTPEIVLEIAQKNEFPSQCCRRISSKIAALMSPARTRPNDLQPVDHRDLKSLAYIFSQTRKLDLFVPSCVPSSRFSECPITRLRCRVPLRVTVVRRAETIDSGQIESARWVCLMTVYVGKNHEDFFRQLESFHLQWVAICRLGRSGMCHVGDRGQTELMPCLGMGFVSCVLGNSNEIDLLTGVDPDSISGCCLVRSNVSPPRVLSAHATREPIT